MAQRILHDLPNKGEKQKNVDELKKKLQLQLESDLLRLLHQSSFYDLELVVDSESLFSHSCLLKTRAARFYTFITTEFSVIQTSVVTTVYIENASIIYIRKFIENIYSSTFFPEAENYVLKYLQNTNKGNNLENSDNIFTLPHHKVLSPECDKFFTPKCSPSELYKPFTLFTTSEDEINLSRTKNNASVRSYYRIVSVDDFHTEHQAELDTSLEKELAEQDELFNSLKCISTKKKVKPATLSFSRGGRTVWKESREQIKRLPAWRPKLNETESGKNKGVKRKNAKLSLGINPPWQDISSPEMDQSSSTPDSGLDLTTNVPMDTSAEFQPLMATIQSEPVIEHDFNNEPLNFESLKNEDIARLDNMEKNIKDCEEFLMIEKRMSSLHKEFHSNSIIEEKINLIVSNKTDLCTPHIEAFHRVGGCGGSILPAQTTPPSSPNTINCCVPNNTSTNECASPPSSNFFIDASSLLDEDEIASPPLSLPITSTRDVEFDEITSGACSIDPAHERRQGELIFRNSIPHFSRHEINEPLRTCDRVNNDNDSEQVVPVIMAEPSFSSENQDIFQHSSLSQSLPLSHFSDFNKENNDSDSKFFHSSTNPLNEPRPPAKAIDIPMRKISVECMPIVSGGASPKDFAVQSYSGSPHFRRRNEQVPIISGGMDAVIDDKPEKKYQPTGEVWVVDVGTAKKSGKRFLRGTSSESESDSGTKNVSNSNHNKIPEAQICDEKNDISIRNEKLFPIEKSASLGYFIDFDDKLASEPIMMKTKKHRNDSSNLKKNIFSMYIDMKNETIQSDRNEDSGAGSLTPKISVEEGQDGGGESDGTESGSGSISSKASGKKPLYMFIEAESPGVKKKFNNGAAQKPNQNNVKALSSDNDLKPSKIRSSRNVWSTENKTFEPPDVWEEQKAIHQSNEVLVKKDSTFIIDGITERMKIKSQIDLQPVIEATPPRSPRVEEGDSGVVGTEESDDSFVKLSDLDSAGKNPYMDDKNDANKNSLEVNRRRPGGKSMNNNTRMTQSIPEGSWQPRKPSRIPERDRGMSKSIGPASATTATNSGTRISKSLSRLFPNLSASTLSLARTHTPDISEPSSMMSSMDPYGLEISTSETDVSCHGDGAARLGQDLLRMFLDEISPDVVVEVGGRRMKAHKCILSSRCQYFAAMLSGGWVESAGNVISLQGFSYSAVHFALCHIYSGESEIPESLNIVELATLADMLCLEGLKEVISYTLRNKYCHSFHPPCPVCTVGVLDCLPVALDYGLDDLYRKCLRWTVKFFSKVWPTKTFSSLRKELIDKCVQYHVAHMTVENVLETLLSIDKVRGSLPSIRWAETVTKAINKLQDSAVKFLADHYSSILTSDQFLAMGKDAEWSIERLEKSLIIATGKLSPEQACWSHGRLHSILSIASSSDPPDEMQWNETFIILLTTLSEHVQSSLIKQAPRAARSKAWQQMEPELRNFIQEAACLVLPNETNYPPRRTAPKVYTTTTSSVQSSTIHSSTRASNLRQVKLAMTQQANRNFASARKQQQITDQRTIEAIKPVPVVMKRNEVRKSQSTSAVREALKQTKGAPPRFSEVKSRYLQPRSPHKSIPEKPSSTVRVGAGVSSSDSSRNCSPAMARANGAKNNKPIRKQIVGDVKNRCNSTTARTLSHLAADDNMSSDSLATESSCGEKDVLAKKQEKGKNSTTDFKRKIDTSHKLMNTSLPRKTQSFSSFSQAANNMNKPKTMIPSLDHDNRMAKKTVASRIMNSEIRKTSDRSYTLSPRMPQKGRIYANAVNGNVHARTSEVDSQNNTTANAPFKPPAFVSRSGTFLKDEPTILKKPQADNV